ncbi:unnamed protein product [Schistosoma curassoni]|uniref:Rod shape-determining protein MreD n=1 Tax=Schistosoma curassoni TaxID=6186 RepID=A0A183JTU8_9TREM|nr:unnamed protein product [Schistosoma curassoni]
MIQRKYYRLVIIIILLVQISRNLPFRSIDKLMVKGIELKSVLAIVHC